MKAEIFSLIATIPEGKVVSYGSIAKALGKPRAAQIVGYIIAGAPFDLPWHRVVNAKGVISIQNPEHPKTEQVQRLESEGVPVTLVNGEYCIENPPWHFFT